MKAYVLHGIGDLRYEEVETPDLKKDTVLVKVQAAGICGSDIPRVYRTGTYSYPLIPGHEFSGIVEAVGDDVDREWLNKRVGIFPLIPCKECATCKKHQYEMCKNYNYLGSRSNGGFAEYVCVPVWNLLELSDEITMEQAAMLEPMAVAVHAIRKAKVQPSDSVAICGMGTIGFFVVMFLQEMGCEKIYAIGNKTFQKQTLLKLGIKEENYCDSCKEDVEEWILNKTWGNGVGVFFDCVGKQETVQHGIMGTMAGGTLQLVGNPASDMLFLKEVYWKILRNQLSIYGTWNSFFDHDNADDWHYVLKCLKEHRIVPESIITHRFSLEELHQGLELMKDKTEDYIKIMCCQK